jgi:hypothetical protein
MKNKLSTPLRAIRKYCLFCGVGSPKEVRECLIKDCALYPYRMGTNPARKGIARADRLVNGRFYSKNLHTAQVFEMETGCDGTAMSVT